MAYDPDEVFLIKRSYRYSGNDPNQDIRGIFAVVFFLGLLGVIVTTTLYISNPNNPSNRFFLKFTFVTLCCASTASGFVAKYVAKKYVLGGAFYIVFVYLFNVLVLVAAVAGWALEAFPNSIPSGWLIQSGFGESLHTIVLLSLFVEICVDSVFYISGGFFSKQSNFDIFLLGIFIIEFVLYFAAVFPILPLGNYAVSIYAGILAIGHIIIQNFRAV
jgi:hypothetical protein